MQHGTRLQKAAHSTRDGIAKGHPGQCSDDQKCAYRMGFGTVSKAHGKHDVKYKVIGRYRQQRLQIGPQNPQSRSRMAGRNLSPRHYANQLATGYELTNILQKRMHMVSKARPCGRSQRIKKEKALPSPSCCVKICIGSIKNAAYFLSAKRAENASILARFQLAAFSTLSTSP